MAYFYIGSRNQAPPGGASIQWSCARGRRFMCHPFQDSKHYVPHPGLRVAWRNRLPWAFMLLALQAARFTYISPRHVLHALITKLPTLTKFILRIAKRQIHANFFLHLNLLVLVRVRLYIKIRVQMHLVKYRILSQNFAY